MDLPVYKIQAAANNDPEFRIAARFWNSAVRLEMGDDALLIRIEKGQVAEVLSGRQAFTFLVPANVIISAPAAEWRKFLERVPQPFYVDLFGASSHHGFSVGGDMEHLYAYYPALRRLFDIMRSLPQEA
jgi:hypothetical protein